MPTVLIAGATLTESEARNLVEHIFPAKALYRPQGKGSVPMARLEGVNPIWVATVLPTLRAELETKEWDINVVPDGLSVQEYRLLCVDMDSTLVTNECIDILGDLKGCGEQIRTITAKAMTGKLRFEDSLRQRASLLEDAPASILEEAIERVELSPGAKYLIDFMKKHGLDTWLFSGGFMEIAGPVADSLGMTGARANTLEIRPDGTLSGKISGLNEQPLFNGEAKAKTLMDCCMRLDVSPRKAISIGDGANDLEMTKISGLGVGYHAKPLLRGATTFLVSYAGLDTVAAFFVEDWQNRKDVIDITLRS